MSNNLIKNDYASIEPAQFEELDPDSVPIIRAKKRKNTTEPTSYTPPLARNVIQKSIANVKAGTVDLFQNQQFETAYKSNKELKTNVDDLKRALDAEKEFREKMRAEWEANWQSRLNDAVENARTEGYNQGFAAAKLELEESFEASKIAYNEGLKGLRDTWSSFINRSETLLLEIAIDIAQFLVDVPLPNRFSKLTEDALIEALEVLAHDVPVRLSLNPVDLMRLQETGMVKHIEEQFPTLRWDPQATLKEGNWIVQTPRQAIRRVSQEILDSLRDRFGLTENTAIDDEQKPPATSQQDQHIPPVTNISVTTTTMPSSFEHDFGGSILSSPASVTSTALLNPEAE